MGIWRCLKSIKKTNKHITQIKNSKIKKENKYIGGCKHQRKGGNEVWISDKCTFTPEIIGRQ